MCIRRRPVIIISFLLMLSLIVFGISAYGESVGGSGSESTDGTPADHLVILINGLLDSLRRG